MLVGAAIPSEESVAEAVAEEMAFPALSVALVKALPALRVAEARPEDCEATAAVTELRALLTDDAASPVAVASWLEREEAAASAEDCAA